MKDASTILSALSLITAGTLQKKTLERKKLSVNLTDNVCLNTHKITKRNLDGDTLRVSLTYRTSDKMEDSASLVWLFNRLLR